jgi:hypothetical protein
MKQRAMWVLWSSFLAACVGEMVFFAIFDPDDLHLLWPVMPPSRIAVYSLGFFFFWFLTMLSGGLTCLLSRTADEVNR